MVKNYELVMPTGFAGNIELNNDSNQAVVSAEKSNAITHNEMPLVEQATVGLFIAGAFVVAASAIKGRKDA